MPAPKVPIRADVKVATDDVNVALKGPQTEAQMRQLYSRASIYAATARYEPLGMAALEAAFSRCAIIANDIPLFRETWGDDAVYFQANDATSLALAIRRLSESRDLCRGYALAVLSAGPRTLHCQAHAGRVHAAVPQPAGRRESGSVTRRGILQPRRIHGNGKDHGQKERPVPGGSA